MKTKTLIKLIILLIIFFEISGCLEKEKNDLIGINMTIDKTEVMAISSEFIDIKTELIYKEGNKEYNKFEKIIAKRKEDNVETIITTLKYSFKEPGEYLITAYFGGISSKPVNLIVKEKPKVEKIIISVNKTRIGNIDDFIFISYFVYDQYNNIVENSLVELFYFHQGLEKRIENKTFSSKNEGQFLIYGKLKNKKSNELTVEVFKQKTIEEELNEIKDWISFEKIKLDNISEKNITSNLNLISTDNLGYNSNIRWEKEKISGDAFLDIITGLIQRGNEKRK